MRPNLRSPPCLLAIATRTSSSGPIHLVVAAACSWRFARALSRSPQGAALPEGATGGARAGRKGPAAGRAGAVFPPEGCASGPEAGVHPTNQRRTRRGAGGGRASPLQGAPDRPEGGWAAKPQVLRPRGGTVETVTQRRSPNLRRAASTTSTAREPRKRERKAESEAEAGPPRGKGGGPRGRHEGEGGGPAVVGARREEARASWRSRRRTPPLGHPRAWASTRGPGFLARLGKPFIFGASRRWTRGGGGARSRLRESSLADIGR